MQKITFLDDRFYDLEDMLCEDRKWVEGHVGDYKVSNLGRVKSLKGIKGRIIRPSRVLGYPKVVMIKSRQRISQYVHRLVGLAFLKKTRERNYINHINGIKHDNASTNLERVTQKENIAHSWHNGLSKPHSSGNEVGIVQLDSNGELLGQYLSIKEASNRTGACKRGIGNTCRGRQKSCGGYIWRRVEEYFD